MRKCLVVCLKVIVVSAVLSAQAITRQLVQTDYAMPPAELNKILERADLIVVGQVVSRTQEVEMQGDMPQPIIRSRVRVIEVAKGPSAVVAGAIIDVAQAGGTGRSGNREVTVSNNEFPILDIGGKYLMFLQAYPNYYVSTHGPSTVLPITTDNKVQLRKTSEFVTDLRTHKDESVQAFLGFLRQKEQARIGRGGGR